MDTRVKPGRIDDDAPVDLRRRTGMERQDPHAQLRRAGHVAWSGPRATGQVQDVIEIKAADHRILTSHRLGEDGNWQQFMTAHYRRTK